MLAEALGYTPLYLHYNSGQHISLNGCAFAHTLEQLLDAWPQPVERLVLLGHSMGGLLMRSAMHQGAAAGQAWVNKVDDLVFLGTPHHGAPLERAGNWVTLLLGAAPYAAPLARLGKLRSAGITDLRHGSLLDEDWVGRDRFAHGPHRPQPVPLPLGPRCYALAASTGRRNGDLKDKLLGDGLVPLHSALGRHADPARCLQFAPEHQWQGWELNHLDLLSSPQVAEQLRHWLE
jgi:pimeloyl-ACP methyl ester carboxylesterase